MHCLHDLGRFAEAARYGPQALDVPAGSSRAQALHRILLARVQVGLGEVEQSCATATAVLDAAGSLRSTRLRGRVREYLTALKPYRSVPAVRELAERSRTLAA